MGWGAHNGKMRGVRMQIAQAGGKKMLPPRRLRVNVAVQARKAPAEGPFGAARATPGAVHVGLGVVQDAPPVPRISPHRGYSFAQRGAMPWR